MSALTNYQILEYNGAPAFVVMPYDEFMQMRRAQELKNTIPQAVVEAHILKGTPIIKVWREYLGLTQQDVAQKSGMLQPAYARIESPEANPRPDTLLRIASAMGLSIEQLDEKTIGNIMNRLGYRLRRVQKAKPLKKINLKTAVESSGSRSC